MLGLNDVSTGTIKELAEIMDEKKLDRLVLENGDAKLTLERHHHHEPRPMPPQFMGYPPMQHDIMPATANNAAADAAPSVDTQTAYNGNVVKSPIVGTYYAAPAPGKPPFVTVGQTVKKGDVLMIIESMKLMNEIQSDYDGTVTEIIAKDGQTVEYDQPIMIIK